MSEDRPGPRFQVLGPLTVSTADGRAVALGGEKPRTMLAALLLADGRIMSDESLIDLLWSGRPPATVRAQLHTYASRLRRALAPDALLTRCGAGYRLDIGDRPSDAEDFARLSGLGHRALAEGRPASAVELLHAALALWYGPALTDVSEALRDLETPRLEEMRLAAVEDRIEARLALGEHAQVVPELVELVARRPLRERLRAQLMTALQRSNRRADALGVYGQGRLILDRELGITPGPALRDAYRRAIQGPATG
ncbi:DNA-binding SARP family transcriptional activator [Actinoalloteichus hoggarensis]|uniref:Transcriptional regulatory protein EmbR n=1 Tax=Actinoalloteichus hoggarensis TaxID=1470176 RepID=A0A221W017_9PSEU|nr:AfsR/SARP family transcriptional regulator [Actinoalloteichus hoggarensis]ASO19096.1 Transcriptional regulatory protein EmbR [Actinoalloteichus hoggarensis]MBB5920333.1 DNA-binding SARP family transcriptional activator [Actinoalloteichus hoggarensis]